MSDDYGNNKSKTKYVLIVIGVIVVWLGLGILIPRIRNSIAEGRENTRWNEMANSVDRLVEEEKYDEADAVYKELLDEIHTISRSRRRTVGINYYVLSANLGLIFAGQGNHVDAVDMLEWVHEGNVDDTTTNYDSYYGRGKYFVMCETLATSLEALGRLDEAEAHFRELMERMGEDRREFPRIKGRLADNLLRQGKVDEAETMLREILATQESLLDADDPELAKTREKLAEIVKAAESGGNADAPKTSGRRDAQD